MVYFRPVWRRRKPAYTSNCTCAQERCWCSYRVTTRHLERLVVPMCLAVYVCSRQGQSVYDHTFESAAKCGQLGSRQWLRCQNRPCPRSKETCAAAPASPAMAVVSRSQDPQCPWSHEGCTAAAEFGHLEALQWLRYQNPPWFMV